MEAALALSIIDAGLKGGVNEQPSVLVVMSESQRLLNLVAELEFLGVELAAAANCREARTWLAAHPEVDVVITDLGLPDGNWCSVLRHIVNTGAAPSVVVASPFADERLWSEALWRGAYELLVEPYDSVEVQRIVQGAVRATRNLRSGERGRVAGL